MGLKAMKLNSNSGKKKKILAAVISYGKKTNKVIAGGLCRKGVSSFGGIRVLLHY